MALTVKGRTLLYAGSRIAALSSFCHAHAAMQAILGGYGEKEHLDAIVKQDVTLKPGITAFGSTKVLEPFAKLVQTMGAEPSKIKSDGKQTYLELGELPQETLNSLSQEMAKPCNVLPHYKWHEVIKLGLSSV